MYSFSSRSLLLGILFALAGTVCITADPLSKKIDLDFFRDVPSRNLHALATRSDGRIVAGPSVSDLKATAPADLLWSLAAGPAGHWWIGTGPEGRIFDATIDLANSTAAMREVCRLDDSHVFALAALPDGALLAGTSPQGGLALIRGGKVVARLGLPADSVFDILPLDAATALVATGNPGKIYRVDLARFSSGGIVASKISDAKTLGDHGITTFGEIRDRNVRRIVRLPNNTIVAGSAPRGNIYTFPAGGGAPVYLQENRDGEVTDLLPQANGDLYATVVFSGGTGEARVTAPGPLVKNPKDAKDTPELGSSTAERFQGRSSLIYFPAGGFPETLTARPGTAFYRIVRQDGLLLMAGGEQGELLGYDLSQRLSLTFAGSASAQINGLLPIPGASGKYILLRNNAPGLAVLDSTPAAQREMETRRIDLGSPGLLGALRFNREREIAAAQIGLEVKTSVGTDDLEGWTPWTPLIEHEGGWSAPNLRGRYIKLRLRLADATPSFELDKASLYTLPQDRRPSLQDFRVFAPNYQLVVQPESVSSGIVPLSQLLQNGSHDDDARPKKNNLLSSQVVPAPGMQVILWTVNDPDGDTLESTFSLRRAGETNWTDMVVGTRESYVQFDTSHLPDGLYFTRLVVTEAAPRPPSERLTARFETDDLLVDHTPPEILDATLTRRGGAVHVEVHGRDALSLLDGIDLIFNNGVHETVEQPVDGIRDSREETFALDLPVDRAAGATSVEVTLYDAAGNGATRRLPLAEK